MSNPIQKEELHNLLREVKQRFLCGNDRDLLVRNANERSVTHKFAEHLQKLVGDSWSVDCEYNRYGDDIKKIVKDVELLVGEEARTADLEGKTVYPDIIVHERGKDGKNLVVIEAKKDASSRDAQLDQEKLRKIKVAYGYQFMVFLNFITKGEPDINIQFVD